MDPPEPAYWCGEVPSPTAYDGKQAVGGIVGDGPNGYPQFCDCAPALMNEDLEALAAGNPLAAQVLSTANDDLVNFRNLLWDGAEVVCIAERIAQYPAPEADGDNCMDRIDRKDGGGGVTPIYQDLSMGECSAMSIYGDNYYAMPTDNWDDYYTLSNVISFNTGEGEYYVDAFFFSDVLATPAWLLNDSAYIDWNGSAFQIYGATSGDIVYALGLRTGDKPLTLNGYTISTVEGALQAHTALQNESVYTLVVNRPGVGNVTFVYNIAVSFGGP
jgi:hypothetical protein